MAMAGVRGGNSTVWIDAIWPQDAQQGGAAGAARFVLLALIGSALIAACAHMKINIGPVPLSMQTFAILLIGLAFGPTLGMATVLAYLAEGFIGLPVFSNGAGPAYFMGPTGGYLAGFVVAAGLVGWLARAGWGRPVVRVFAAMLLGSAVIYLCGWAWLSQLIGAEKAFTAGVLPFLVGDAIKAALAALALPAAWHLAGRSS